MFEQFFQDFLAKSLFDQIAFLVPFIGVPTLLGLWSARFTNSRLRKALEGQRSENELLLAEIDELRSQSLGFCREQLQDGSDSFTIEDAEATLERNSRDIAEICERISLDRLLVFWDTDDRADRENALRHAHIAKLLSNGPISNMIFEELSGTKSSRKTYDRYRDLSSLILDMHTMNEFILILGRECDDYITKGDFRKAKQIARFGVLVTFSHGYARQPPGFNCLFFLVRSLFSEADRSGNKSAALQNEILEWSALFVEISDGLSTPKESIYYVARFHYATALSISGRSKEALELLEKEDYLENLERYCKENSSVIFATRHLYCSLLFKFGRSMEAERELSLLESNLSKFAKLSRNHIATYLKWRSTAGSDRYKRGEVCDFSNTAHLTY